MTSASSRNYSGDAWRNWQLQRVPRAVVDPVPTTVAARGSGTNRARRLSLLLLAALAAVSLRAAFEGERSTVTSWLLAFFLLAPLAIAVPGLIARNRRTYAWATLCVTPHFIYALTELVANPSIRMLAAAILMLSLALVVVLVAYLRLTRAGAG